MLPSLADLTQVACAQAPCEPGDSSAEIRQPISETEQLSSTILHNFLKVAVRNAIRNRTYTAISVASLVIGLTCAILIMLFIRYEMSYDALAGRNFSQAYAERSKNSDDVTEVLINETAAKRFGWTRPAGQSLLLGQQPARVVGMFQDFHVRSLREPMGPVVLSAAGSNLKYLHLKIKEHREQETLSDIMKIWAELVPTVPFDGFYIDDYVESRYSHEFRQGALVIRSAIVAILLACLGTMGLAAFAAERRTREIAIRKVIGASEGHLLQLVAREFPMLALLAGAVACPVAYLLTQNWLRNFAYRIDLSAWPFLLSVAITLLVAIATVIHLARRAARTNPVDVLRRE